jgi:acyl-CoA thioester hydrolase
MASGETHRERRYIKARARGVAKALIYTLLLLISPVDNSLCDQPPGAALAISFAHPLTMITSRSEIIVRYAETRPAGFAGHERFLPWFEVGRTAMLKEYGLDYREFEAMGVFMPVLEIRIKYHRPTRYDDVLSIVTCLRSRPTFRVRLDYQVLRGDETLADGHCVQAFVSVQQRPIRPPASFLEKVDALFPRTAED